MNSDAFIGIGAGVSRGADHEKCCGEYDLFHGIPLFQNVLRSGVSTDHPPDNRLVRTCIPKIRLPSGSRVERCTRHFDAVLVSMLTTWTRRLIGSIGAFGSFGLVLP